jgi:hypothetical protein
MRPSGTTGRLNSMTIWFAAGTSSPAGVRRLMLSSLAAGAPCTEAMQENNATNTAAVADRAFTATVLLLRFARAGSIAFAVLVMLNPAVQRVFE